MRLAMEQAAAAEAVNEVPVGAVVVKDGVVIAVGRNRTIGWCDPSAHAEIVALREAAKVVGSHRLDGLEMFVTLEPCPMCAGAIFHSRISRLVYGAADPKTGSAGSVINLFAIRALNHHTKVTADVLGDECASQLRLFFKSLRFQKSKEHVRLRDDAIRSPVQIFSEFDYFLVDSHYFVSKEGWRIHYIDTDDTCATKTILCLHDFPFWSFQFRRLVPFLKGAGFRVLVPDLIGCGLSDKPKNSRWHSVVNHVNLLQEFLENLNILSPHIISTNGNFDIADKISKKIYCKISTINLKPLGEKYYFDFLDSLLQPQSADRYLHRRGFDYKSVLSEDDWHAVKSSCLIGGHSGVLKFARERSFHSSSSGVNCSALSIQDEDIEYILRIMN